MNSDNDTEWAINTTRQVNNKPPISLCELVALETSSQKQAKSADNQEVKVQWITVE